MKILQFILFFPRRVYYATFSPEQQFKKLLRVIKRKKPGCYYDFDKLLRKRFFVVRHPGNPELFNIPVVGNGFQIQARFVDDDTAQGLWWISLFDTKIKKQVFSHEFKEFFYSPPRF